MSEVDETNQGSDMKAGIIVLVVVGGLILWSGIYALAVT
jgi:hypothetical protein